MTRWLVEITGDRFDIEEFPFWFPDGDPHAVTENGKVFLVGEVFEAFDEASKVHEEVTQVLAEYFEIIRLLQPALRMPTISIVFRESSDGSRQGFAVLTGVAEGRSKAHATLAVAGEPEQPTRSTQAQELLAASRSDPHLRVAVSLASIPGATWPHLYRCLEELESYLNKEVSEAGLCTDKQRTRFRRTANTAEVSGKNSRHGLGKFKPPHDPMSISEARAFVSQILQATLHKVPSAASRISNAV